jgi:hypothetical protein
MQIEPGIHRERHGARGRPRRTHGGSAVGEIVRFREANGRVTRMYVGESYSERVP